MPYRHAHWWVLALVPIVGMAFWRDYFGTIGTAPFAFHAHGLTASAWILLVGAQSWTIQSRRHRWHRALGRAVLVVVPLFAGASVLVIHSMAVKFATKSHPFYAIFGARLGLHDVVSTVALVAMVTAALRKRRVPALHGGYLLATVLLVFPPIMARLPIPAPPYLHLGEMLPVALALALWARNRRSGGPWLILAALLLLQIALFETLAASAAWAAAFVALSHLPPAPYALAAVVAAGAVLASVWPRRPVRSSVQPAA